MSGEGLDWRAPAPPPAPLPFGWTDADLATLANMSQEFGIAPIEVLALFYSESGLNPQASREGLAGLTPIVETEMHWPRGTIAQLNAGPITGYLQAVFQLWAHVQETYVRKTFPAKGAEWGTSPGTALYTFHGFLGPAMAAHGPGSILGRKPPVWPVLWVGNGWTYQGAPVSAALGRGLTGQEVLYSGNPGLDIGHKGTITVGDMAARVKNKAEQLKTDPQAGILYRRLMSFETLPTGDVPPLSSLFGAVRAEWQRLTGTDVRIHVATLAGESPNFGGGGGAPPDSGRSGSSGAGGVLLLAGAGFLAWQLLRRKGSRK